MTYSVDTLSGVIEKIDFEEAERMIMQPPRQLTLSLRKEVISKQVNEVLALGLSPQGLGSSSHRPMLTQ